MPTSSPSDSAGPSLPARLLGVLTSPAETFAAIVARPAWLGALAVVSLLTAALWFGFLSTEVGQQAMLDQQERQAESFGRTMTAEQYAGMERMLPLMRFIVPGTQLIWGPLFTALLAGILFAVFNAGLGGTASFKQVMAVVSHSGVVMLLQQVLVVPLNYVRESMSSATNVGVLFQTMLDEQSLLARLLGMIDVFLLWWVAVLAIGFSVLYRRRMQPILWSFLGVYLVIALAIAGIMRMWAGGAQ